LYLHSPLLYIKIHVACTQTKYWCSSLHNKAVWVHMLTASLRSLPCFCSLHEKSKDALRKVTQLVYTCTRQEGEFTLWFTVDINSNF
jgi:hypothetical protein